MGRFISGKELGEVIYDIIWEAKDTLLIVSPYIKLDEYFKKLFNHHINNHKLHIIIVFGKNQDDVKKSFSREDFDFFKKFLNISIIYIPNLHGKYYGNESKGVVTSINLYDYSFNNNIEFGIYSETTLFSTITNINNSVDEDAWKACMELANTYQTVFINRPMYEKKLLNLLGKNYVKSEVLFDCTEYFFNKSLRSKGEPKRKTLLDFPDELELGVSNESRPSREQKGYCIRTGVEIPYDPQRPYCDSAYKSWAAYRNPNYKEKFCHKTGNPSNGRTSMRNPIL